MESVLQSHLPQIAALCERFGVRHMEVFGSAADNTFQPATSDYDFLVELDDRAPGSMAMRWIELADALERMLGRHVDLVSPRYIENPILRRTVDASRITLYDRAGAQAAA